MTAMRWIGAVENGCRLGDNVLGGYTKLHITNEGTTTWKHISAIYADFLVFLAKELSEIWMF